MNDINSVETYRLVFYFDIPYELCLNDEEDEVDLYCNQSIQNIRALEDKWIAILSNQRRFVSDNYDGKGHIVKETDIEWLKFPRS